MTALRFVFVIFAIFCENDSLSSPCVIIAGPTLAMETPLLISLGQKTAAEKIAKIPKNIQRNGFLPNRVMARRLRLGEVYFWL